jgi:RNA polymerase sigma-70 factor (ECF subfamily)
MNRASASLGDEIVALLPRLRRLARSLTRRPADADDLVQIAVERALASPPSGTGPGNLAGWLFRILRNAWIDEIRHRRRWSEVLAPPEAGENVGDETMGGEVNLLAVQQAMDQLPPDQRLAVALVLVEGLSYGEAAEVLEVPVGTLTSRLARARQALQATLA